jgi:hypothetical protein
MLRSGEQVRRRGSKAASSEMETRPSGRQALERGGDSPEGASGPRARWRLTRGGVRPSSEMETRPRGTATGRLVGRCGFSGHGPFFASGRDHTGHAFVVCGFVFLPFIIF